MTIVLTESTTDYSSVFDVTAVWNMEFEQYCLGQKADCYQHSSNRLICCSVFDFTSSSASLFPSDSSLRWPSDCCHFETSIDSSSSTLGLKSRLQLHTTPTCVYQLSRWELVILPVLRMRRKWRYGSTYISTTGETINQSNWRSWRNLSRSNHLFILSSAT